MSLLQAELSILWPALIAGFLVVLSHVPLGQQVLARGIVFIDLAIAQVAGLGVIAAHVFGLGASGWTTQVAAAAAALAGALLMTWTERKRPELQEALIGVLFVLASTAQILILANDPHGGEDLKDLLAGQIPKARSTLGSVAQKAGEDSDIAALVGALDLADKASAKAAMTTWSSAVAAHKSARAADRPLAMQAGMPTPS